MTDDGWDDAPCGLLVLGRNGTVLRSNRTLLDWLGRTAAEVDGALRLSDLLSVGGRIYWETHLSPLLHVEGGLDEVALELRGAHERLPVLLSARASGDRELVHVAVSGARERSRYEREVLAARRAAERAANQLQALQATTAALSQAVGVDALMHALLDAAVGPLGAAAASAWVTGPDGALAVHGGRGEDPGLMTPLPAGVVTHDRAPSELEGRLVVPLHGQASLQGVLSVRPRLDAGSDPLDVEVLRAVGQQAGLALDRAQLYEQSASVARELQHSLLAGEPPSDPRYDVATVYRPGVELLEVGGDWHDVFVAEDGVLSFVVGDVVGRGLGAASAMGQLRSAVRAVAGPEVGPARLLTRLDRFVDQVEAATMATLAYAELDLESGRVRYACAGHPPPLLLRPGGESQLLWAGRSTPLGGFVRPLARDEGQVDLQPGDRLLLFTDGLFERRGRDLDEGLALVADAASLLTDLSLHEAVQRLTHSLLEDESTRDDVCVLLLRWDGARFCRQLGADLSALRQVRRELGGWLVARGVSDDVSQDLVLAASEAVANAGEHGGGLRREEQVTLHARLEPRPRQVVLEVTDEGRWRTAESTHERGRGLQIMRALVDEVLLDQGPDGTRVVLRKQLDRGAS